MAFKKGAFFYITPDDEAKTLEVRDSEGNRYSRRYASIGSDAGGAGSSPGFSVWSY